MHAYSTHESRVSVYAGLAIVSVPLAWGISAATSHLTWPQWLVGAPSMAGIFALLYWAFEHHVWRWGLLRALGIVKIVDIAGSYNGKLISTYQDASGQQVERGLTLKITQTWTRILVEMSVTSQTSSSASTSALASVTHDGSATCLTYVYRNKVNPAVADADMGDHDGAADLRIYADGRVTGRYFNSRPQAGTIEAKKS